jgi:uncharacterized membrane protein YfcA
VVQELLIIVIFLTLGGVLKGATGMGVPIIAVPALAVFFDVPFAIAILTIPLLVTNIWQVWRFREHRTGLLFLPGLLAGSVIGIIIGTWLLTRLSAPVLSLMLGITTLLYIAARLAQPDLKIGMAMGRRLGPTVGVLSGILQGAAGISAPVSVTFMNGMRLSRPQFLFAASSLFLVFVLVQIPALALAGILTGERALYSAAALLPIALGMWLGGLTAKWLEPKVFDRVILVVLAFIAVKLFWDAATGL